MAQSTTAGKLTGPDLWSKCPTFIVVIYTDKREARFYPKKILTFTSLQDVKVGTMNWNKLADIVEQAYLLGYDNYAVASTDINNETLIYHFRCRQS